VAGQKIYRTVDDVEGIVLLKVRPKRTERDLSDPMWPGAAFAREFRDDEYIKTFLGYEHSSSQKGEAVTPGRRGYIGNDYQPNNPSNLSGYRYVIVVDEKEGGKRWRYSGSEKIVGQKDVNASNVQMNLKQNPNYDLNIYRYTLDRQPALRDSPAYGVTFEDDVDYSERLLGLASSTIKVVDLTTQQVLGEFKRYAWTPASSSPSNPTPWLTAYTCGGDFPFAGAETRQFVDQVLKPRQER
jgi:hypothetical protein